MSKRESGWYRVWINESAIPLIGIYDRQKDEWGFPYADGTYLEDGLYKIDPKMVMTLSGQIVYNQPAHDTMYNTKQEG